MATLVFDIGGTRTRVGLYDSRHSQIVRSASAATPNHLDLPDLPFEGLRDGLLSLMGRLGDEVAEQQAVREVGVAFAGPIDPAGNVLAAPTLWGARLTSPYPLGQDLARSWPKERVRI